jgi:hypothetical protein
MLDLIGKTVGVLISCCCAELISLPVTDISQILAGNLTKSKNFLELQYKAVSVRHFRYY